MRGNSRVGGGVSEMQVKVVSKKVVFAALMMVAILFMLPVVAAEENDYIPDDISANIVDATKGIILEIVDFLTPIVNIICTGMIIVGLILVAARLEYYGVRLIVGGGVGLAVMNLIIPMLLSLI